MTDTPETNERGNRIERSSIAGADRYIFDFGECNPESGWKQFDTDEDASYFGVWVHPERLETLTFAEGDITRVFCADEAGYRGEIEDLYACYNRAPAFRSISEDGTLTEHYEDPTELLPPTTG